MRRIKKKSESTLEALETFMATLKRKYGPTFTVDMNQREQATLVELRDRISFTEVVADDVTCDLNKELVAA